VFLVVRQKKLGLIFPDKNKQDFFLVSVVESLKRHALEVSTKLCFWG
jgi:hypothetical protein